MYKYIYIQYVCLCIFKFVNSEGRRLCAISIGLLWSLPTAFIASRGISLTSSSVSSDKPAAKPRSSSLGEKTVGGLSASARPGPGFSWAPFQRLSLSGNMTVLSQAATLASHEELGTEDLALTCVYFAFRFSSECSWMSITTSKCYIL